MKTYPMHRKYENLLTHVVWLRSNSQTNTFNISILNQLMSEIEFLDSRSIPMSTVEKIIYHYVVNNFSRTPYEDFDPCEYQNSYIENNNDIEKIKFMIAYTCGNDVVNFNEYVKEELKDFDLKFNFMGKLCIMI